MKLRNLMIVLILLSLSACSYNQTIGTQKIVKISNNAEEYSEIVQEIPVDAKVDSVNTADQESASEADVTPDTISTITGGVGKLLAP